MKISSRGGGGWGKDGCENGRRAIASADNAKAGHFLKQIYRAFGYVKFFL